MLFSYHAEVERAERIKALEETLGFTSIALEVYCHQDNKRYCLTTSGVLLVKAATEEFLITAMMANIDQCYRLYRMAGKSQIAPKMYKRVTKNMERHSNLFLISA